MANILNPQGQNVLQSIIQQRTLPTLLQNMGATPEQFQQAGVQQPQKQQNSILGSPAFSQAMLNLGAALGQAHQQGMGLGPGLAMGGRAFGQTVDMYRTREEEAERRATQDALALMKDQLAMDMENKRMAMAQAASGRAERQFQLQMEDRAAAQAEKEKREQQMAAFREGLPEEMRSLFDVSPSSAIDIYDDRFQPRAVTPHTDLAKLTMDYQNGLITKEAYESQTKSIVDGVPEDAFDSEDKLRDEYTNLSKPYLEVTQAYNRIQSSVEDPSAAGDLALIFNYMKMLDPGSTVREGEFANAENSAGIPERVRGQYNKVISGKRLSDSQRNDFTSRAEKLYGAAQDSQAPIEKRYTDLAKRYKLNPDNIVGLAKKPDTSGAVDPALMEYMTPEERALFE